MCHGSNVGEGGGRKHGAMNDEGRERLEGNDVWERVSARESQHMVRSFVSRSEGADQRLLLITLGTPMFITLGYRASLARRRRWMRALPSRGSACRHIATSGAFVRVGESR